MNLAFAIAGGLTLLIWGIHTFLGGPTIARPLLEAEMEVVAKYTNYYCWHIVTITLAAMGGGFLYAAWVPEGRDVGILVTALCAAYALWSLLLVAWKHRKPFDLPQWLLFVVVTGVALVGVFRG